MSENKRHLESEFQAVEAQRAAIHLESLEAHHHRQH
jgi:hypothetical protein